jgi:alcohol oxidase
MQFLIQAIFLVYRVSNESATLDDFLRGDKEVQKELFQEWETSPEVNKRSSTVAAPSDDSL